MNSNYKIRLATYFPDVIEKIAPVVLTLKKTQQPAFIHTTVAALVINEMTRQNDILLFNAAKEFLASAVPSPNLSYRESVVKDLSAMIHNDILRHAGHQDGLSIEATT